ncbi:hypothetical protein SMGES_11250 [Serratia marcescens]|nr:hypothetical protein SMGES_11250 [Serratia marcescens]
MNTDYMFNAVLDEAERVSSGEINYSESWISKLDGDYDQGILREAGAYPVAPQRTEESIQFVR